MTGPADALDQLIRRTRCLLLDFDGPICDIFAGHPAPTVAAQLRDLITAQGIELPADITHSGDPIVVFTYSGTISPGLAAKVEAEMADQEVAAVHAARPAPYVHDVVISARESGRSVGVVSNNSERAVRAYLDQHGLADRIDCIAARTSPDPALLKPNPHLLHQAITELAAAPDECVLVGDQPTDMQAARTTGIDSIGYANKPGKTDTLAQAGATAVVTSLAELVLPLRARPLPN
ncbi:MAG: HAD family hydrolase [Streptosporangiaceae bacterium]